MLLRQEQVRKEIWTYVLAYNLIRRIMAQAASQHGILPRNISFKATLQVLEAASRRRDSAELDGDLGREPAEAVDQEPGGRIGARDRSPKTHRTVPARGGVEGQQADQGEAPVVLELQPVAGEVRPGPLKAPDGSRVAPADASPAASVRATSVVRDPSKATRSTVTAIPPG